MRVVSFFLIRMKSWEKMPQTELWKVLNLQYLSTGHEISPLNLSNEYVRFQIACYDLAI